MVVQNKRTAVIHPPETQISPLSCLGMVVWDEVSGLPSILFVSSWCFCQGWCRHRIHPNLCQIGSLAKVLLLPSSAHPRSNCGLHMDLGDARGFATSFNTFMYHSAMIRHLSSRIVSRSCTGVLLVEKMSTLDPGRLYCLF